MTHGQCGVLFFLTVVEGRLFVVERRKPHALEVSTVSLLAPHHDPHRAPLSDVHWLDDARDLVNKCDGAGNVVQHLQKHRRGGGGGVKNDKH